MIEYQQQQEALDTSEQVNHLTLDIVRKQRIKELLEAIHQAGLVADRNVQVDSGNKKLWAELFRTYQSYRIESQMRQMSSSAESQSHLHENFQKVSRFLGWSAIIAGLFTIFFRIWEVDQAKESSRYTFELIGLILVPLSLVINAYPRGNSWRENAANYQLTYSALSNVNSSFTRLTNQLELENDNAKLSTIVRRLRTQVVDTELILHMEFRTWSILHSKDVEFEA
jgi:hypothetical protein